MSDANRVLLSYGKEVSYGVTPAVAFQAIRFNSDTLGQDTETTTSQEIRSDRQVSDVIRTNLSASGDISGELSYGTYDEFIQAALLSADWTTASSIVTSVTNLTFAASGQTVTSATDEAFASLTPGAWVTIIHNSGTNVAANRGTFRVASIQSSNPGTLDNNRLVLEHGLTSIVDEASGANITVRLESQVTNGTTLRSYNIEKGFLDLSNIFELYSGMSVDTWNLAIGLNSIVNTGFGFIGSKAESKTSSSSTGAIVAAPTNPVQNSIDNIAQIKDASSGSANLCFQNFTMDLANNLRARGCIGRLGAASIGSGSIGLTGTVQALFESHAIIDQYLNFTTSFLINRFRDSSNNRYILDIPAIKYTNARRVAGGINTDVVADLSWTAFRNPSFGHTIRVVRIPGP